MEVRVQGGMLGCAVVTGGGQQRRGEGGTLDMGHQCTRTLIKCQYVNNNQLNNIITILSAQGRIPNFCHRHIYLFGTFIIVLIGQVALHYCIESFSHISETNLYLEGTLLFGPRLSLRPDAMLVVAWREGKGGAGSVLPY